MHDRLSEDASASRSRERYRRAGVTAASSAGVRVVAVLTGLATIPLAIDHLGLERFGIWVIISSTAALLGSLDLGLGNSLVNVITHSHAHGDRDTAQRYVSSAGLALVGVAVGLGLVFAAAYPFVNWGEAVNVTSARANREAGPSVAVFVACVTVSIPLSIAQRVQSGFQSGYQSNLWIGIASLLGLGGVVLCVSANASLPWMVLALTAAPVLAACANFIMFFGRQRPDLRPRVRHASRTAVAHLARTGGAYFVLQIASAVAFSSDAIVIAHVIGPEAVGQYSVPFKMFSFIPLIAGVVIEPLWPAYGDALARGDTQWIRTALARSVRASIAVAAPLAVVLVVFGRPIVHFWAGAEVTPTMPLLVGLALWTVIICAGIAVSIFLNGLGKVRLQATAIACMLFANIGISVVLCDRFGVAGAIWGTIISYVVLVGLPLTWAVRGILKGFSDSSAGMQLPGRSAPAGADI